MTSETAAATADSLFATTSTITSNFSWSPEARRLGTLRRWLVPAMWFYIFVQILGIAYSATQALTPYAIPFMSVDDLSTNPVQAGVVLLTAAYGFGGLIALFLCAFLFARFAFRATKNLWLSRAKGLTVSPPWAIAWYFIPFANFVKPLASMNEMWRSSHQPEMPSKAKSPAGLWWGLWIVGNIVAGAANLIERDAVTNGFLDVYRTAHLLMIANDVLMIGAAVTLLWLTNRIRLAQDKLFDEANF